MAAKGEARAKISLDYSGWTQAAKAVKSIASDMLGFVKTTFAVAFGSILAAALLSFGNAAANAIPQVLMVGEELANMTRATGVASGEWAKFQLMMEKHVNFSDAGEILGKNAELLSKDSAIFRDIQIKIAESGYRVQGFWIGFADKIAPVMSLLLDKFNALDLSKWGQEFAEPIANVVAVIYGLIQNGELFHTAGLALSLGLAEAKDTLVYLAGLADALFKVAFNYTAKYFIDSLKTGFMNTAFDVYNLMVVAFKSAISLLGSYLINEFRIALAYLSFGLSEILPKLPGFAKQVSTLGSEGAKAYQQPKQGKSFSEALKEALGAVGFKNSSGTQSLSDQFSKLLSAANDRFNKDAAGAKKESNINAFQNFGVSNLQRLGLGGTVNGIQQSVEQQQLDVQKQSLKVLQTISEKVNVQTIPLPAAIDSDTNIVIA